jgi:phage-related minor tail protein
MVKGVKAATEYQTLQLKTAAVIKSTGNVAHLSVAGIDALASRLESMSGVDETLIINSENVLATFTNIRNSAGKNNDIYNQATGSILDLSVAMGEDLQTATVQVGKALNDPVKGMTALQRVGVTFNSTQKDTIKHLVASGNVMGAQKIILGELNKEFGGAAKAAGSWFRRCNGPC